jgi:hypothetical protein
LAEAVLLKLTAVIQYFPLLHQLAGEKGRMAAAHQMQGMVVVVGVLDI